VLTRQEPAGDITFWHNPRVLKHFPEHILLLLRLGFALGFGEGVHLGRAIGGERLNAEG
jgi:hypothetical protein